MNRRLLDTQPGESLLEQTGESSKLKKSSKKKEEILRRMEKKKMVKKMMMNMLILEGDFLLDYKALNCSFPCLELIPFKGKKNEM